MSAIDWQTIQPDDNNDWLNQRDKNYQNYSPIFDRKNSINSIFSIGAVGISSNRDVWVYGFSKDKTQVKISRFIENYNTELYNYFHKSDYILNKHNSYIKWSRGLERSLLPVA